MARGLRLALLAAGLALVADCARPSPSVNLPEGAYVLDGEAGLGLLSQCSRATPAKGEATFHPDAADIVRLEAELPQAIVDRAHIPPGGDWPHLDPAIAKSFAQAPKGWWRQYVGLVRQGRRFVYGNFVPAARGVAEDPAALAKSPEVVCDGGPAFFGAEYDPAAGRFTHLAFNGPG